MRAVLISSPTNLHGSLCGRQTPNHSPPPELMAQAAHQAPPLQRHVDHTYRDFSNFPLEELPTAKQTHTNFPTKLHQILSNPEYAHVSQEVLNMIHVNLLSFDALTTGDFHPLSSLEWKIISWMPHGRAWKIHNKELLIRDVVPKYFVQTRYESFTRQIIGWGFKRLHQAGNDFNALYHECFLRGLPHLTVLMKRVQPNQGKLLPHVEGEPNFYDIELQYPLPSHPISSKDQGEEFDHDSSKHHCRVTVNNHNENTEIQAV